MKGGKYLKKIREQKKLTQLKTSQLTGRPIPRLSEWENDLYAIKLVDFIDIAEKVGVKDYNSIFKD